MSLQVSHLFGSYIKTKISTKLFRHYERTRNALTQFFLYANVEKKFVERFSRQGDDLVAKFSLVVTYRPLVAGRANSGKIVQSLLPCGLRVFH